MTRRPLEYWTAGRDREGNIRMDEGRGVLIAGAHADRAAVEGMLVNAGPELWRHQYRAALELIAKEELVAAEITADRALQILRRFRTDLAAHEQQEGAPVEYKNSRGSWDDVTVPVDKAIQELS